MAEPADAAAIEALSQRLRAPLRRYFEKRLGRRDEEIDDLVQEVFVRLVTGSRLESVRKVEAYLFQTAANLLKDRHRRLTARGVESRESYEELVHGGATETVSPERALLGQEAIERLIAALYGLPERTRSVWVLYHIEDLPHAEIGRQLGMAQSTVEKHMRRANVHLLKYIDRFL